RLAQQGDGLRRVAEVAAVDQRGVVAVVEQDVVGRKPAAFEHLHAGGQPGRCAQSLPSPSASATLGGSGAATADCCGRGISAGGGSATGTPLISSEVRPQP